MKPQRSHFLCRLLSRTFFEYRGVFSKWSTSSDTKSPKCPITKMSSTVKVLVLFLRIIIKAAPRMLRIARTRSAQKNPHWISRQKRSSEWVEFYFYIFPKKNQFDRFFFDFIKTTFLGVNWKETHKQRLLDYLTVTWVNVKVINLDFESFNWILCTLSMLFTINKKMCTTKDC